MCGSTSSTGTPTPTPTTTPTAPTAAPTTPAAAQPITSAAGAATTPSTASTPYDFGTTNPFYASVIGGAQANQAPRPYSTGAPDMSQLMQMFQQGQIGGM